MNEEVKNINWVYIYGRERGARKRKTMYVAVPKRRGIEREETEDERKKSSQSLVFGRCPGKY